MTDPLDQDGRTVFATLRLHTDQTRGNNSPCTVTGTIYTLVMVARRT